MNVILEQINSAGLRFVEFALPMFVQSGVLILILLLTDFALRKKVRAVFRYGIWLLVLIKLVLPTSLSAPLSLGYFFGDQLAYVDRTETTTEPAQTAPAIVSPMIESPSIEAGSDTSAIAPTTPNIESVVAKPTNPPIVPVAPLSWQGVVFLAWLTVVITMVLLLLQRAIFVRGLVAKSKEANGFMNDTLVHCRERMGVKRKVGLKVSANAASPAVCGLFRPVILVPQKLMSSLNPSQLRAVLLHELAHIRRGDLWVNLAQTILQIIYFYNPLLWVANCLIRRVREQAVDEMVLVAMGEKAQQYPQALVDVAKLAFKRPALSLRLIGVVESKSALAGRIKHILNRPMPKKAKLGILGLAVVIITAAILLPMATCTPGPPSLVIKGTVKDAQTQEPIVGARVFDDGYGPKPNWEQIKANERSEWGAITNSTGEYSFLTWPEHHSIKVEAPGYKAERQSLYDGHFVFNKKDEEIFDFALEPEKPTEQVQGEGGAEKQLSSAGGYQNLSREQRERLERLRANRQSLSYKNMQKLGLAVAVFANDHKGRCPSNLSDLRKYIADEKIFDWINRNVVYLGKNQQYGDPPDAVLAYDESMLKKPRQETNVLYNDAHVSFEKSEWLELKATSHQPGQKPDVQLDAEPEEAKTGAGIAGMDETVAIEKVSSFVGCDLPKSAKDVKFYSEGFMGIGIVLIKFDIPLPDLKALLKKSEKLPYFAALKRDLQIQKRIEDYKTSNAEWWEPDELKDAVYGGWTKSEKASQDPNNRVWFVRSLQICSAEIKSRLMRVYIGYYDGD